MPPFSDIDIMILIKDRTGAAHVKSQGGLGKNKVKQCHEAAVLQNFSAVFSSLCAEACENNFNFILFRCLQFL